jgi:tetratricopeptide (TPR) repeat protein
MRSLAQVIHYSRILAKRAWRPFRPFKRLINPLLKKIRLWQWLAVLLLLAAAANWQYWQELVIYRQSLKQKQQIDRQITGLRQELDLKPQYRDVLLRLSLLSWQIKLDDQAQKFWEKANYLDPNNQEVERVGKIIF